MMVTGGIVTPFTSRLAERFGPRALVTTGFCLHDGGADGDRRDARIGPRRRPWRRMILVGLAGPLVMPPVVALLLHAVSAGRAGVASGVFSTGRQAGGALAIAVFGALLAHQETFVHGLRISLLIAAIIELAAAAVSWLISPANYAKTPREGSHP